MKGIPNILRENPFVTILLVLVLLSGGLSMLDTEAGKEIKYNKFMEMVKKDNVKEATVLDDSNYIFFEDKKGNVYKTPNPKKETLVEELLLKDVKVTSVKPMTMAGELQGLVNFFLRMIVFYLILKFIFDIFTGSRTFDMGGKKNSKGKKGKNDKSNSGGGGLFGLNNKDFHMTIITPEESVNLPKFKDIAGNKELKKDLQEIVKFLKEPESFEKLGAKLPKGVLLSGEPGTGKTMIAKAVAAESNVTFIAVSGSDFIQEYVGTGAKRVRKLFNEARKHEKAIIFIDEFDGIGGKRKGNSNSEEIRTINSILDEMDGFVENENIIVMAATNRLDNLDPAVIRPGRFDKKIAVALPEYEERLAILKVHAEKKNIDESVDLEHYARTTIGLSGAYLAAMLNEAAILAGTHDHERIMEEDMEEAYFRILTNGLRRDSVKRNEEEIEIVSIHESGHALTAKRLTDNDVTKVTIVPSTSGTGGFAMIVPKKMGLFTKEEMLNDIRVTYAGRAAEQLYFNGDKEVKKFLDSTTREDITEKSILAGYNFTTGASQDIVQATEKIHNMFTSYGMSNSYGMLQPQIIRGREGIADEELLKEAKILSNQLYYDVLKLVYEERELLREIANALKEKETLSETELIDLIKSYDNKKKDNSPVESLDKKEIA